jgi:translocation protein SEC63
MIVQALWEIRSPMMQLPHITEDMQKYFMSKKRQISSIQQFCEMKDEDRRAILKSLTSDQYVDVMKVCASMPLIDFNVHVEGRTDIYLNNTVIYAYNIFVQFILQFLMTKNLML